MTRRETLDESLRRLGVRGDALRSAAHFAISGGVYREARREPIVGRDAIVAHFTHFFRDGPRFTFVVDETIVEGDRAAVRFRFSIAGADETWRERDGCAFVAFSDGTIAEWREYGG